MSDASRRTQFTPGSSGNPDGARRATVVDVVKIARKRLTKPAIDTLERIMKDPNAPASAQVRAAEVALERAWGSPAKLEDLLKNASAAELERLTKQIIEQRERAAQAAPVVTVN